MKIKVGSESLERIRCRLRFDFIGFKKPGRFIFGGRDTFEVAEEKRQQNIDSWQNMPIQGVEIEQIEPKETYAIFDEEYDEEVAYAPVELIINVDSPEEIIPFIMRENFTKIELHHPESIDFNKAGIEKFFRRINEELGYRLSYIRKNAHT